MSVSSPFSGNLSSQLITILSSLLHTTGLCTFLHEDQGTKKGQEEKFKQDKVRTPRLTRSPSPTSMPHRQTQHVRSAFFFFLFLYGFCAGASSLTPLTQPPSPRAPVYPRIWEKLTNLRFFLLFQRPDEALLATARPLGNSRRLTIDTASEATANRLFWSLTFDGPDVLILDDCRIKPHASPNNASRLHLYLLHILQQLVLSTRSDSGLRIPNLQARFLKLAAFEFLCV